MKESTLSRLRAHPAWLKKYPLWYEAVLWRQYDLEHLLEVGWRRDRDGFTPLVLARVLRFRPVVPVDGTFFCAQLNYSALFATDRDASRLVRLGPDLVWDLYPELFAYTHGD